MKRKNILIEQITSKELAGLETADLRDLRSRFIDIFNKYFLDSDLQKAAGIERKDFVTKYMLLRKEMDDRKVSFFRRLPIDQELGARVFKSSMWGLDIGMFGDMLVIPDYICVSGDFIKSPKKVGNVEVIIKNKEENRSDSFEAVIGQLIKDQTRKEPVFIYKQEGPESSYIPLFDLILKARKEIEKIKVAKELLKTSEKKKLFTIQKPEENGTIRIPVGPECEVTATIKIDVSQGISALYCGNVKKVRTFIFDKKKKAWTMATARAWINEHKEKVNKKAEENLETFEYLIHHVSVEGDEEIIHHCHMYDHIGNLFEQVHLWIDKGKIFLDGKEIKEGHFHVIKGLEETQEVAWSEEEATDAKIKPKRMMSGMTLKQKAKVW
jgi:hypothetical protein